MRYFEIESNDADPLHHSLSSTNGGSNPQVSRNVVVKEPVDLVLHLQVPTMQKKLNPRALVIFPRNLNDPSPTEPASEPPSHNPAPSRSPPAPSPSHPAPSRSHPAPSPSPPTASPSPPTPSPTHLAPSRSPAPSQSPAPSRSPAPSPVPPEAHATPFPVDAFQAAQPPPLPPAFLDQPRGDASSSSPPESGSTPTPVIHSEGGSSSPQDRATRLPSTNHIFNLSNSSQIIFVPSPTHISYPSFLSPEPQTPTSRLDPDKHVSKTGPSSSNMLPLPYYIGLVFPVVFFVALSLLVGYGYKQRRKHGSEPFTSPSSSPDNPTYKRFPAVSFGGVASTIEKERQSMNSNGSFPQGGGDMKLCSVTSEQSGAYPALPPLAVSSPLLSSPMKMAYGANTSPIDQKPAASPDLQAAQEGTPCKRSCIVTQTFSTSLSDELMIAVGDRVVVYLLFDDGWCLGDNLDIEKHQTATGEKYPRIGVLPQDCLSGLDGIRIDKNAKQRSLENPDSPTVSDEEFKPPNPDTRSFLSLCLKPQRASSLQADREANLYLEIERALALEP